MLLKDLLYEAAKSVDVKLSKKEADALAKAITEKIIETVKNGDDVKFGKDFAITKKVIAARTLENNFGRHQLPEKVYLKAKTYKQGKEKLNG